MTLLFIIGIFFIILFTQCNKSQELGADFFPDEAFSIGIIDTLSLNAASVLYDSLPTRNTGRLLVGYHEDQKLGKISASAYFQVGLEENKYYNLDKDHDFYDSLTLVIKYDGYSYYDTNQVQTLNVHEVLETIEIPDEDTSLYNTTAFHFNQMPLGERTFVARPGKKGTVSIRLSDHLGKAIYNMAVNKSEYLSSTEKFHDFLKGLVLVPDTNHSAAMLGFSPAVELRFYYHNDSQLPVQQQTFIFQIGDGLYFNHIESHRSNTYLAHLKAFETPIPSQLTHNEAFIQSGIGIATRIEVPNLKDITALNNDFVISKAILEFYPSDYQNNTNTPLPSTLTAYWVDKDNQIIGQTFTAYLQSDNEFDRDTHYQIDITTFIKTQLAITENNKNALLFTTGANFKNSFNRIIIGDDKHANKMRLKIYIISI